MVQTIVRSNRFPDPVSSVWEHTGVRSIGSDHSSIWVGAETLEIIQMQSLALSLSFLSDIRF